MKKTVCFLLSLLLILSLVSCNVTPGAGEDPTSDLGSESFSGSESVSESVSESASVSESESDTETETEPDVIPTAVIADSILYLFVDDSYELSYRVSETDGVADGEASEIVWNSSDESCVTVSNGTVQAHAQGYAIVSGGGETSCIVRVISKTMPTITIDTQGAKINSRETYTPCLIDLESDVDAQCFEKVGAGIRYRGNSTYNLSKKPYRIKFTSKRNLLGMNEGAECKSWVLLADRYDNSMIRNSTCLSFASIIVKEYTSDWRYVRLVINGKDQGVYLLAEQPQIQENRVNIEEAGEESTALKSGYMIELNSQSSDPIISISGSKHPMTTFQGKSFQKNRSNYDLKNNGLTEEQKTYIAKYFSNVFEIAYLATFKNEFYKLDENHDMVPWSDAASSKEVIEAVVDMDSLVRMYILTELIANHDAHQKSMYWHVDFTENGSGKLIFSCPWDFDFTMYNFKDKAYYDPEDYMACNRVPWFVMMMNHAWFREMVQDYWNEIIESTNHFEHVMSMIREMTEIYGDDFIQDGVLWSREDDQVECANTVYQWLQTRIAWLDIQFGEGVFGGIGLADPS
ncbi:MAG: hypothetical protein E7666_02855 [Ruminococcaceae bacterium]|nr:hypothetical protein [Oscillospiraceae bacterium]